MISPGFQLLLALVTYSGSFHPTAEGHAAIADAVADKARTVLKKYKQGTEAEPELSVQTLPPPVDEPNVVVPVIPTDGPIAPPTEPVPEIAPRPPVPAPDNATDAGDLAPSDVALASRDPDVGADLDLPPPPVADAPGKAQPPAPEVGSWSSDSLPPIDNAQGGTLHDGTSIGPKTERCRKGQLPLSRLLRSNA